MGCKYGVYTSGGSGGSGGGGGGGSGRNCVGMHEAGQRMGVPFFN